MAFDVDKIQPEIWNHIFTFLKRVPPPAYRHATWSELHQRDLVAVSQVSTTFHEIAIPHLYTSIVTDGLPLLLDRLDDTIPSLASKITSKRDRLRMVKHLRITSFGPVPVSVWSYSRLLKDPGYWRLLGETAPDFALRMPKQIESTRLEIARVLSPLVELNQIPAMPELDTVVIGQINGGAWRDGLITSPMGEDIPNMFRDFVTECIMGMKPRIICAHDEWTLYSPHAADHKGNEKLEMICRHYHRSFERYPGPFVTSGVVNRSYVDPRLSYDPPESAMSTDFAGQDRIQATAEVIRWWSNELGKRQLIRDRLSTTSIDLFGFCTPLVLTRPDKGGPREAFSKTKAVTSQSLMLQKSARIVQEVVKDRVLRDRVKFYKWADTPPCEGCGWTVDEEVVSSELGYYEENEEPAWFYEKYV